MLVGVTGGLGCGKSTVLRMFQALGAHVLDADTLVHTLYQKDQALRDQLFQVFGDTIRDEGGDLDLENLARLVFSQKEALKVLEALVHPKVWKMIEESYGNIKAQDPKGVVLVEVPLLFESQKEAFFDKIICVACSEAIGLTRFVKKRKVTMEEAKKRLRLQWTIERKKQKSHFIIDTDGTLQETEQRVKEIWEILKEER